MVRDGVDVDAGGECFLRVASNILCGKGSRAPRIRVESLVGVDGEEVRQDPRDVRGRHRRTGKRGYGRGASLKCGKNILTCKGTASDVIVIMIQKSHEPGPKTSTHPP